MLVLITDTGPSRRSGARPLQGGTRVLVTDDHPVSREGLSLVARAALPGAVIVSAETIEKAVAALGTRPAFRLILLDYHLPDSRGFSGLLALQHLAPTVPIVIVTAREDPALVEAAKALGASGFLFKSRPIDELATRVREVLAGFTAFPPLVGETAPAGVTALRGRIAELSRAQRAVLIALADGRSNKEIARNLAVTEATVKAHLTAIFRKLGVANRTQALLALGPLFRTGEPGSPP